MENTRKCKRCLLRDFDENAFVETVNEYINSLNDEEKINEITYKERLGLCLECDNLISGMCKLCGCFVEVRAIKKITNCPDTPAKW